jgi:hypothetical protein
MRVVYVSGPISKGDLIDNIRRAHWAGVALLKAGLAPCIPHGSCFWGNRIRDAAFVPELSTDDITHAEWLAIDLEIVGRCDAVLRLDGESKGADMEVAHARDRNIPVFFRLEDVLTWAAP